MVEVTIKTGRKHQIRTHLAQANFPILGDRLYDPNCSDEDPDLCLAAYYLAFDCPITNTSTTDGRKEYKLPDLLMPNFAQTKDISQQQDD